MPKKWRMLETARCSRCLVYADKSEILLASDGTTYCTLCGPPKLVMFDEWAAPPNHENVYRRALSSFVFRGSSLGSASLVDRPTRIVALSMALVVLLCFIAACASQT